MIKYRELIIKFNILDGKKKYTDIAAMALIDKTENLMCKNS